MSEAVRCTEVPGCHNGGVASSLSAILEDGAVPQRYYLTGPACAKALERIARRGGKSLTPMMRAELEKKASQ
jgi:predicted enzyme related to lactoylglutathione lyase